MTEVKTSELMDEEKEDFVHDIGHCTARYCDMTSLSGRIDEWIPTLRELGGAEQRIQSAWQIASTVASNWAEEEYTKEIFDELWLAFTQIDSTQQAYWYRVFSGCVLCRRDPTFLSRILSYLNDSKVESQPNHDLFSFGVYKSMEASSDKHCITSFMSDLYPLLSSTSPHVPLVVSIVECVWSNMAQDIATAVANIDVLPILRESILAASGDTRELIIKKLLSLYLTSHDIGTSSAATLFDICSSLYREEDIYNCSTALCCCLEGCVDDVKALLLRENDALLFSITWACCNHTDNLLRKRGAYILEQYRSLHDAAVWIEDYLAVYQQVDGCTSQHLIDQVWPVLDQMMSLCDCRDDADETLMSLQFVFLQPLFRCLLTAPAPAVRKHTLQRILRNLFALPLEALVLRWLCTEVITVLDNPVYFVNTALITPEETRLMSRISTETLTVDVILDADAPVSDVVSSNPGLQLHIFLTQLLLRLHLQKPNLLPYFVNVFCACIAGDNAYPSMKSFSALKWMLRPLTFDAVRGVLVKYKVIDGSTFLRLKSYIENKLVTANGLVKKQLYDGLVSLVLCSVDVSSCSTTHILSLLSYIGLPFIIKRHESLFHHFCSYLLESTNIAGALSRNATSSDADAELLGVCLAVTCTHSEIHASNWNDICGLYGAVYTPTAFQRKALHYAYGWLSVARLRHGRIAGVNAASVVDYVSLLLMQSIKHIEDGTSATEAPVDDWNHFSMVLSIACDLSTEYEEGGATLFCKLANRLETTRNDLVILALLQCLASLRISPGADCDVNKLYQRIIVLQQPTSEHYWQLFNSIFKGVGGPQNSLVTSIIELHPSYGAYCDWMFRLKWKCIRMLLALPHGMSCEEEQLRQLHATVDQLELSSSDTIENILHCCYMYIVSLPESMHEEIAALLPALFATAWNVCMNEQYFNHENVIAFIRFAYSPAILKHVSCELQQEFFEKVLDLGYANKPHLLNILVSEMYPLWKSNAAYITPYIPYLARLLTSAITLQDDANSPDIINTICLNVEWVIPDKHFIRVVLLALFEEGVGLHSVAESVIDELVVILNRKEHQRISMIGSVLFLEKLYAWQALCVLSKRYVTREYLQKLLSVMFASLLVNTHHSIRVHIELFCGQMISLYSDIVLPRLLSVLQAHNHSAQALASYFVILGHFLTCGESLDRREEILEVVFPWMTCGPGLPRAIAQYICIDLLPQSQLIQFAHVRNTLQLLTTNKEIVKLYKRQKVFFDDYNLSKKCSVSGLLQLSLDLTGEFIPTHLIPILQETVKEYYAEDEEQAMADTSIAPPPIFDNASDNKPRLVLQRKKIVFNELKLKMSEQNLSRESNNLRKRHSIILCASLIDKATNLAGMARTCEIFAAEELILHDLSVVDSDVFQNIAVSSSLWLPMREVPESNLIKYLKMCRANGYTILGIEQTDRSQCLSSYTFPKKCVLLLGREKEGIPVEYLQIVDQCIEIPQFGVTRSLNVHVSAALCVWEYTRQQITADIAAIE